MPDQKTQSTFKLRDPEPGKVELSLSIEGNPVVVPVTHQALWNLVKDGIRMLDKWPLKSDRA